jgi:hypothetical protein
MKDNTVKCPNCKEVFKVDDSVYTDIVKQVRDQQLYDGFPNHGKSNPTIISYQKESDVLVFLGGFLC